MLEANTMSFVIYHPYHKEKLRIKESVHDFCFYYRSDKLKIIAFMYLLKALFDLSYTAQTIKFLPDNIIMINKQLQLWITNNSRSLSDDQSTLYIVFTNLVAESYLIIYKIDIKK